MVPSSVGIQLYLEGTRFPGGMTGQPLGLNSNQEDVAWVVIFVAVLTKKKKEKEKKRKTRAGTFILLIS